MSKEEEAAKAAVEAAAAAKAAEEAAAKEGDAGEKEKEGKEEDSAYKAILNLQETHKSETDVLKAEYDKKLAEKDDELGKARYKIQDISTKYKALKKGDDEGDEFEDDPKKDKQSANPFDGMTSDEVIAKVAAGVAAASQESRLKTGIQEKLNGVADQYHRKALEEALKGIYVKDPDVAFKMASSFVEQQVKDLQSDKGGAKDTTPNPGPTNGASYAETGEKEPDYLEALRVKYKLKKPE